MTGTIPPGYGPYADVLARLGPLRESGGGLTFTCPFPDRHKHNDRTPSCRVWIALDGKLMARCMGCGAAWEEIVEATGTRKADWWPDKGGTMGEPRPQQPKPKHTATYRYHHRDGSLAFEKLRYDYPPAAGDGKAHKTFRTRRPLPAEWRRRLNVPAGAGAWAWGLVGGQYGRHQRDGEWDFRRPVGDGHQETIDLPDAAPILYRLPELIAAGPPVPVFVVEGEKDADLLAALGFVATCGHAGAGVWLLEWAADFAGRRVVVVPDHDTVGYQHADAVAGSVVRAGAAGVRVLRWDTDGPFHPGAGGGIGNWLETLAVPVQDRAAVRAAVVGLCKAAPEYTRPVARPAGEVG